MTMKKALLAILMTSGASIAALGAQAEELTIATVNNGDMIVMQKLSPEWEKATGNKINWVILEENVLRQRVTTDIATKGGQFDVLTIGSYETPIWGKQGWLMPLDDFDASYDYADLIPSVANALSIDGKLMAAPFYGESSFTMYRKDLVEAAGLTMPAQPSYDDIKKIVAALTDKSKEQYGICLRGKPGWGENMAFLSTMVNTYGGQWFNMEWKPQIDSAAWTSAITDYVQLMTDYGPPGATNNGFNENQALFQTGKCAVWIDATSAAGRVFDPAQSQVADKIAFTAAPQAVTPAGSSWFWTWNLAIPASSTKADAAKSFIAWATSKEYIQSVGKSEGWVALPPGTRKSTYALPEYQQAAPFAATVLASMESVDTSKPTKDPVPYIGIQYAAIPEFQAIGTFVGQQIASALAGQSTVEAALKASQDYATTEMTRSGYIK